MPEDNKSFSSDQSTNSDNSQGTDGNKGEGDNPKTFEELGISVEDVIALQKRDENAQPFIETLKEETKSLRDEMSELKDAFIKGKVIDNALDGDDLNKDDQTGLSEEELLNKAVVRMKAELKEDKAGETKQANFKSVTETLTEKFGDKVDDHMTKICKELGMTWDDAVELAESKPAAALKLFGADAKSVQSFSKGTVNTSTFTQEPEGEKVNLMDIRRDKDRVNNFQKRLEKQLANMGS